MGSEASGVLICKMDLTVGPVGSRSSTPTGVCGRADATLHVPTGLPGQLSGSAGGSSLMGALTRPRPGPGGGLRASHHHGKREHGEARWLWPRLFPKPS